MIPSPVRTEQGKVSGEFYPLQKAELIALRKAKLINNTAFVHLALRYENPYCDRPLEVIPKEFAIAWAIPESSVYEAIAKLKEKGILKINIGRVVVQWVEHERLGEELLPTQLSLDCQQEVNSENPESLRDPRKNSEIPEKILRSQKKFRDPRKNSEIPEKRRLEAPPSNTSTSLQTIQTFQTNSNTTNNERFAEESFPRKLSQESGVLEKFEEQLKFIQFYLRVYQGDVLVSNPKIEPITRVLTNIPPPDAERSIKAFLQYAKTANVKNVYAAMFAFIQNRWSEK